MPLYTSLVQSIPLSREWGWLDTRWHNKGFFADVLQNIVYYRNVLKKGFHVLSNRAKVVM
jgi:hypothetical protein